jgi:ferredoxin, 2Fe-2S
MTKITFIERNGATHVVNASADGTIMQAAKAANVPSILADCGGACACATCHVVVDTEWFGRLPAATDVERQMLEFAVGAEPNSRLSCQIAVTEALDGLILRLPADS